MMRVTDEQLENFIGMDVVDEGDNGLQECLLFDLRDCRKALADSEARVAELEAENERLKSAVMKIRKELYEEGMYSLSEGLTKALATPAKEGLKANE